MKRFLFIAIALCSIATGASAFDVLWKKRVAAAGGGGLNILSYSSITGLGTTVSGSVSVPAAADFAIFYSMNWTDTGAKALNPVTDATLGTGGSQITLTKLNEFTNSSTNAGNLSVFYADVSSLAGGSETLAGTRAWIADEGGGMVAVWFENVNASTPIRDNDNDNATSVNDDVTITLTTVSGDIALGFITVAGTAPGIPTGFTQLGSQFVDDTWDTTIVYRATTSTSETIDATVNSWPHVTGVVLEP